MDIVSEAKRVVQKCDATRVKGACLRCTIQAMEEAYRAGKEDAFTNEAALPGEMLRPARDVAFSTSAV